MMVSCLLFLCGILASQALAPLSLTEQDWLLPQLTRFEQEDEAEALDAKPIDTLDEPGVSTLLTPLESFNLIAGGRYRAFGTFSSRLLYPTNTPVQTFPANFAFDPANERFVWFVTPNNVQYTLKNQTYFYNNGVCSSDSKNFNATVQAYTAATYAGQSTGGASFTGLVRDPATCNNSVGINLVQAPGGILRALSFGQVLNLIPDLSPACVPGHVAGLLQFTSIQFIFDNSVFNLPPACWANVSSYCNLYCPNACCFTPL